MARKRSRDARFMDEILQEVIVENEPRKAKRARTERAQEECDTLPLMVRQGGQDPQYYEQLQDAVRAANDEIARDAEREKDMIR